MARYGSFKWGSGTKWGASTLDRRLTWAIEVDWNDDGVFDGSNEMSYMLDMNIRRGREFFMKSDGSGFEPRFAGNIRITLKNNSGRFDPFNPSGPLYGLLESNQRIRIRVKDEATSIIYPVFFGYVEDIRPNYSTLPTVTLTASDGIKYLGGTPAVSSTVYTTRAYTTAISDVLTAAGWEDATAIDTTLSDTMPFFWLNGNSAYGQIVDLTDAVLGNFYISATGAATFIPRTYGDSSLVSFSDHDALKDWQIRTPSPRYTVQNVVKIYNRARRSNTNVTLWTLTDKPQVLAGDSIIVWAAYSYNNQDVPATTVTPPVATTDYTSNTATDGSGADLTAAFTVALTTFATTGKLVITNTGGTSGYVTLLKVRGDAITPDDFTFAQTTSPASIVIYGERQFIVKTNWLQDLNTAIDQASVLIGILPFPRRYPQFMVRGQPAKQFLLDLTNQATLGFASIRYSDIMRVGYIEHNVTAATAGNICDTIFYFEPDLGGGGGGGAWTFPATFPMTF